MRQWGRAGILVAGALLALAAFLAACGVAPSPTPGTATPASPLAFTAWLLTSLDGQSPVEGSAPTLFFRAEHQATGSSGCRPYVASVLSSGDEIGFVAIAPLGPNCLDREELREQEGQFSDALSWATGYRLAGDQLEIQTLQDQVLRFEPLPPQAQASLEGTAWTFVGSVEEQRFAEVPAPFPVVTNVLEGTDVTATFQDGVISGSTGCNTYRASTRRDGAALTLGELSVTERGCSESIMEQEQRVLGFLDKVTGYHVYGGQLWLETDGGPALVFSSGGDG